MKARSCCSPGFALVAALLVAVSPSLLPQPIAAAEPAPGGQLADSPTLALTDLGANSTIAFYGQQGSETINLPVSPGLVPDVLTATVELPVNVRSASITVSQDDRTISRVNAPTEFGAPVVIPLAGVQIRDNAVKLVLRAYLLPVEGYCLNPTNPLRLANVAVRYSGTELPPSTVAEFLPPILDKLTVFVPESPTQSESDAALRVATAVVGRYGTARTEVQLLRLREQVSIPPAPSQPLERQIVIREGPDTGVGLQGAPGVPFLLISGSAADVSNESRLIFSNVSQLAIGSKAVVGPLKSSPQLPADSVTIRELGQPGVNASALSPQVNVPVDQTRLGRSAHDVRVHLIGSYTPLPGSVNGQIVVAVGGDTVARWPADGSGEINRWVDVPDRVLQRYTNLGVAVNISGNTGGCGEFQPITLTIDGATAVSSSHASPPVPGGLQSMPQSFMPRVQVGLSNTSGPGAFADTSRAVAIMSGLQRLSALPLDTAVMPIDQALNSANPAVVIAADGWKNERVKLPVSVEGGEITVGGNDPSGAAVTLTLQPTVRFASLQTVVDGDRSLLVATSNGAAGELDRMLAWLNADGAATRWSRLSGTTVIGSPGRDPLTINTAASPAQQHGENGGSGLWWWAAVAAAGTAVALGLVLIITRRRKHSSTG